MEQIKISREENYISHFQGNLDSKRSRSWKLFKMAYQMERLLLKDSFSRLTAKQFLPNIKFMPHQLETAKRVIGEMSGRAILADEVGLGKTIEACLILKEYMVRGFVSKVLILVPASLISQWIDELNNKFFINALAYRKNMCWKSNNIIVASLDTAKRSRHQKEILGLKYDLVIVDEAHKLKNEATINYHFVSSIKKTYCLLLTATPVQNELKEIFNLISIIRPGLLGDYDYFKKNFEKNMQADHTAKYLNNILRNNLIRNTRRQTQLDDISRSIKIVPIHFSRKEKLVYERILNYSQLNHAFTKMSFLRQFCSSREACYLSLQAYLAENEEKDLRSIKEQIKEIPQHAKAGEIVKIIRSLAGEKVIIFTEFVATQHYLQWFLTEHGISSLLYNGSFSKSKKDWMLQLFKNKAQVLIATEAASEGINLQFCRNLINYDLPWNPMKIEQRIGRIHRYGQKNKVRIYNFIIRDTIEEQVFNLLFRKLQLFSGVIGELERILTNLDLKDFEQELDQIIDDSRSEEEIASKLDQLSAIIQEENTGR